MTIKRLAFIGVLMAIAVVATMAQVSVVSDPPGVTTRWWDGTMEKQEVFHENGKIASRTTYGDDGKTIITHEEWDYTGTPMVSRMRQPDGRVHEKLYLAGGRLYSETLWLGDMAAYVARRHYDNSGRVTEEIFFTEDGLRKRHERRFSEGVLVHEYKVLENAEQYWHDFYPSGKPQRKHLLAGDGFQKVELFYPNGVPTQISEGNISFGNGHLDIKQFGMDKEPVLHYNHDGKGKRTVKHFMGGDLHYVQNYTTRSLNDVTLVSVDLYEGLAVERPTRTIFLNDRGAVVKVHIFRKDGSLKRVKHVVNDKTVRQIDYDESGKNITNDQDHGEEYKPFYNRALIQETVSPNFLNLR